MFEFPPGTASPVMIAYFANVSARVRSAGVQRTQTEADLSSEAAQNAADAAQRAAGASQATVGVAASDPQAQAVADAARAAARAAADAGVEALKASARSSLASTSRFRVPTSSLIRSVPAAGHHRNVEER